MGGFTLAEWPNIIWIEYVDTNGQRGFIRKESIIGVNRIWKSNDECKGTRLMLSNGIFLEIDEPYEDFIRRADIVD